MNIGKNKSQNYNNENEYIVEKIIDKKIDNGKPKYLIKWFKYSHCQNTWEPLNHLRSCLNLVEEFEISRKNKGEKFLKNKRNLSFTDAESIKSYRNEVPSNKSHTSGGRIAKAKAFSEEKQVNFITTSAQKEEEKKVLKAKRDEEKAPKASKVKSVICSENINLQAAYSEKVNSSDYANKKNLKRNISNTSKNNNSNICNNSNNSKSKNYFNENEMLDDSFTEKKQNIYSRERILKSNSKAEKDLEESDLELEDISLRSKKTLKDHNRKCEAEEVYENIEPTFNNENDQFNFNQRFSNNFQAKKDIDNALSGIYYSKSSFEDDYSASSIPQLNNSKAYFISRKGVLGRDTPKRISGSKFIDGEIICCIDWLQINQEEILLPSEYNKNQIKIYDPFLLLDYYEKSLKFKSDKHLMFP